MCTRVVATKTRRHKEFNRYRHPLIPLNQISSFSKTLSSRVQHASDLYPRASRSLKPEQPATTVRTYLLTIHTVLIREQRRVSSSSNRSLPDPCNTPSMRLLH